MGRPRQVKVTGKNSDGHIISLVGRFGEISAKEAIRQIEAGEASYKSGDSKILVVNRQGNKHLRSSPDGKAGNNLASLPDA